jgi:hypothetical protein
MGGQCDRDRAAAGLHSLPEAGAIEVVDSSSKPFATLSRTFDVTLNFAAWDDDLALIGTLRDGALGHATTVHPLLANFDELGWVRGVLKTLSDKRRHRAALPKNGRYVWTVSSPRYPRCKSCANSSSSSALDCQSPCGNLWPERPRP